MVRGLSTGGLVAIQGSLVWRRRRLAISGTVFASRDALEVLVAASHPVLAYAMFKTAARTVPRSNMVANCGLPGQNWAISVYQWVGERMVDGSPFPPDRPVLTNGRATVPHERAKSINGDR